MTLTAHDAAPAPDLAPASPVLVARVRSRLDELTEPRVQRTRQWVPVPGAAPPRLEERVVEVRMPGLLAQLEHPADDSTAGSSSTGPGSRPPGSLEGASWLQVVEREARVVASSMLARLLGMAVPGVQVTIRPRRVHDSIAVVRRYVGDLDRDELLDVERAVRRWWARARIVTTWDTAPFKPHAACPHCAHVGRLQLRTRPIVLVCLECGEAWDTASLADLGTVYELAVAAVPDELAGARS